MGFGVGRDIIGEEKWMELGMISEKGRTRTIKLLTGFCRTTSSTPSDEESDRSSFDLPPRSLSRSFLSCRSTVSLFLALSIPNPSTEV